MSITLPPLPERNPRSYKWTEREKQELRARDIEVARLVLEAAAKEFDRRAPPGTGFYTPEEPAEIIRALEVRHHE